MVFVTKLVFCFCFKGGHGRREEKNRLLIKTETVLLQVQRSPLGEAFLSAIACLWREGYGSYCAFQKRSCHTGPSPVHVPTPHFLLSLLEISIFRCCYRSHTYQCCWCSHSNQGFHFCWEELNIGFWCHYLNTITGVRLFLEAGSWEIR